MGGWIMHSNDISDSFRHQYFSKLTESYYTDLPFYEIIESIKFFRKTSRHFYVYRPKKALASECRQLKPDFFIMVFSSLFDSIFNILQARFRFFHFINTIGVNRPQQGNHRRQLIYELSTDLIH